MCLWKPYFIEVQQINERTPLKNKFLYPKSAYRQFAMAIKSKGTQYHEGKKTVKKRYRKKAVFLH